MAKRRKYRKKAGQYVIALQLKLDTDGFTYRKWGAEQRCKKDDWIVDNGGDIYSVDAAVFANTYRQTGEATYVKATAIWAEKASQQGSVVTKEGTSHYHSGDYLVYNNADGTDAYCISAAKFESMYELDE